MRLVDFLIYLLQAHGQTLGRLGAFFGEEAFIELLETAGEKLEREADSDNSRRLLQPGSVKWIESPLASSNAYAELEGAVHEMNLPAVLQFHLWAYPHYRAFIESPIDLQSRLSGVDGEAGVALVNEACARADEWFRQLPISPSVVDAAQKAAQLPWLRFRTEVLKRIGKRPFEVV